MSHELQLAVLDQRITRAERSRDAWRATAGGLERYLEACSMIDALILQREKLHKARIAASELPGRSARS